MKTYIIIRIILILLIVSCASKPCTCPEQKPIVETKIIPNPLDKKVGAKLFEPIKVWVKKKK